MSNSVLKKRIAEAVREFETDDMGMAALKSAVLDNGSALEGMPYALIKEMDDIEYKLTVSQFYDGEDPERPQISPQDALNALKVWLSKVPD